MNVGLEGRKGATSFKVGPTSLALGVTPRDTVAFLLPTFLPTCLIVISCFFCVF